MKNKVALFLMTIICMILSSCKKGTVNYYLTAGAKRYASYSDGTYWIVRNDSTLIEDSLYVISLKSGFENHEVDGNVDESKEYISCIIKSTLDTNLEISYGVKAEGKNNATCSWAFNYCCGVNKTSWYVSANIVENGTGEEVYSNNQRMNANSLVINGTVYPYVYLLNNLNEYAFPSSVRINHANLFEMKYIGILKWNILFEDNSYISWSLLRYHIIF